VIVPRILLPGLEDCLRVAGVPGMSIDNVRGFGEHAHMKSYRDFGQQTITCSKKP